MESRSPDFPGGVETPGLSLRLVLPGHPLDPFGSRLPASPVSECGADHHRKPVVEDPTKHLPPVPFPSLPFGTFIPWDPHLAAATTVANGACARLGTCERTYRAETPDFSSLLVQLIARRIIVPSSLRSNRLTVPRQRMRAAGFSMPPLLRSRPAIRTGCLEPFACACAQRRDVSILSMHVATPGP
jgi:hypothetical protein